MFDDELENTGKEETTAETAEETAKDETPPEPVEETAAEGTEIAQEEPDVTTAETAAAFAETDYAEPVTVQPVQFTSFDASSQITGETNQNLDILMDVKLPLTVELGRCELPIKKVLELTRGSIVSLDKVAGEPVELYANGKHIANGEVVVIEDNFGLRITNITDPEDRMKSVQ